MVYCLTRGEAYTYTQNAHTLKLGDKPTESGEASMKLELALAACGSLIVGSGAAMAHHSFAMFDQSNPVVLEGVVQDFKFTNPHSFIVLLVTDEKGGTQTWNLEGTSPSSLVRSGWTGKTLKAGDEIKVRIWPLRSGAPGGGWNVDQINFRDGKAVGDPAKY